jgi:hypothetical protein
MWYVYIVFADGSEYKTSPSLTTAEAANRESKCTEFDDGRTTYVTWEGEI